LLPDSLLLDLVSTVGLVVSGSSQGISPVGNSSSSKYKGATLGVRHLHGKGCKRCTARLHPGSKTNRIPIPSITTASNSRLSLQGTMQQQVPLMMAQMVVMIAVPAAACTSGTMRPLWHTTAGAATTML
jgi:hypothetical protein